MTHFLQSLKTSKIHIFFHCFARNDWEEISHSLLRKVRSCKVNCTLIGEPDDERKLIVLSKKLNVELTIRRFASPDVYEHEAMNWLKENAKLHPDDYTLYFHTKGAANPSQLNIGWRLDMIYSFLSGWRSTLQQLQDTGLDVSGLWFGSDQNDDDLGGLHTSFFAGNFWMARNSYLNKLPDYRSLMEEHHHSRYLPERYIGFGSPTVLLINQACDIPVKGENGIQWKIIHRYSNLKVIRRLKYLVKLSYLLDVHGFTLQILRKFSGVGKPMNSPKIGIIIHVFHLELFDYIIERLLKCEFNSDLIVTCPYEIYDDVESRRISFSDKFQSIKIISTENKGRDILPFLKVGDQIMKYDFVCKLHTKKSDYAPELSGWFNFLIDNLIGNKQVVKKHISTLQNRRKLGIISPGWFHGYPGKKYNWGSNQKRVNHLIKQLGLEKPASEKITYPAGSMFWFRPLSLQPLFINKEILSEFEEENGQLDGTAAHAVERMFHLVAEHQGFKVKICGSFGHRFKNLKS